MQKYNHKTIEKKWQKVWSDECLYETSNESSGKENFYFLSEFPYPSGNLHVGHWYAFAVPDIFVRFKRMQGFHVLFPIGFDAFGLPAENAAIKHGVNPREWTEKNIAYMTGQIESMGGSFDWSRKVITCQPEYYRWTQWLFLQLFQAGLVYRKEISVNWCPSCKTVLANEQVVSGECERCNSVVEKRNMKQWSVKITDYADRLIDDLESLEWPEEIKTAQRNWIGRSEGSEVDFVIFGFSEKITVFTTRPDTLFGVTYVVLAPEHPLVSVLTNRVKNSDVVRNYVAQAIVQKDIDRLSDGREKTGVLFEGVVAVNPANGEEVPIFVADYVLGSYGTGAVMAVPAHDERDYAFAKKYDLPVRQVVDGGDVSQSAWTGSGVLVNSGSFDGMTTDDAKKKIIDHVGGRISKKYRLRDWTVSRQRYWGVPIPLVYCESCAIQVQDESTGVNNGEAINPGWFAVSDDQLPVLLPEIDDFRPSDDGKSPLSKSAEFVEAMCPRCGGRALRETDTLDTFVCSSWYFLRYCDPKNARQFASSEALSSWMPVDFYSGGSEHTTMHVLYSRFFHKALFDLGLVSESEPYVRRMNRGMILGTDGQKMSKSKGNVLDPDKIVAELGADTMRLYLAFIGPYNEVGSYPWSTEGIIGMRRFLERVWRLFEKVSNVTPDDSTMVLLHRSIEKVAQDITALKFNTAVSQIMVFLNHLEKSGDVSRGVYEQFLLLLSPFAPHMSEELWHMLGNDDFIHVQLWPVHDESLLRSQNVEIVVQINGRVRDKILCSSDASEEDVRLLVFASSRVLQYVGDKDVRKFIYVPRRLVNIVV
ncbi:MAG: leucine--tRNA ligase [Candidatus Moranbacteria bacterium]|nr:leucine--tRNA ligase [Candidatus Moranbacteria bacterium]